MNEINKKLIPVNFLVRKSEKKAQEEKRLFIENRFRVSVGLKPFLNFQEFLDSDPEEFNELSEKIVLEEAARILIDQINFNKPKRLSSSYFSDENFFFQCKRLKSKTPSIEQAN